jgi:exodeoxyribonuclease V beta subunit
VDLAGLDGERTPALVRSALTAHALLDATAHTGPIDPVADVLQNLRDLAAARVHAGGPTLAELCRGPKVAEWKFTLPAAADLGSLARLFAEHGSPIARRYAPLLAARPPRLLAGFLTGFVDLVTTHAGRHWIVDWKSNHLGGTRADYGADALAAAMLASDYVLQYHLYVLALHRQVRTRTAGGTAPRVGGVAYAFLRGAAADATTGMFHDEVPPALVVAMDRWAGGAR